MTDIDRAQLAALDASNSHNVRRYEYGEFDTMKTEDRCHAFLVEKREHVEEWQCARCKTSIIVGRGNKFGCKKTATATPPLIQERATTHGDFSVNSQVSQAIKRAIRTPKTYMELHDYQKEALDHVAGKIGRIIAGDADFLDHWTDIAGYAQLVMERIKR